MGEGGELVIVVRMAELAICVILDACENYGATGGAGGGGGVGMGETNAICGQCVEMGRLDDGRAITSGDRALVIGDEENDVWQALVLGGKAMV